MLLDPNLPTSSGQNHLTWKIESSIWIWVFEVSDFENIIWLLTRRRFELEIKRFPLQRGWMDFAGKELSKMYRNKDFWLLVFKIQSEIGLVKFQVRIWNQRDKYVWTRSFFFLIKKNASFTFHKLTLEILGPKVNYWQSTFLIEILHTFILYQKVTFVT